MRKRASKRTLFLFCADKTTRSFSIKKSAHSGGFFRLQIILDLVGIKGPVQGVGGLVHVGEVGVAVRVGDVDHLGDVVLVGHDDAAGMALLLEQDELADAQAADLDAEFGQRLAAHAVAAVAVFHWN